MRNYNIKETISRNITKYREASGLSQKELARKLGVVPSRISNWETGANCPTIDILFKVCAILDVSINDIYGVYPDVKIKLSYEEVEHIKKYRSLDPFGQESVNLILDRELSRKNFLDEKDKRIFELETSHKENAPMRIYTYLNKIACAGKGFYFEDIPTATIEAPYMEDADFIVGVSGSSMEPTYSDGDRVYVHRCQIVNIGEIGIFYVNGDCLIKEAGDMGLISHNPAYSMIPGSENIICVGKVLGKVDSPN